ncbi:hypothetical protein [Streptomyces achromogenes]|uniref:hypothetical protein n=1 Tax=Streptomyces achromogenes TaxID=67255 RepID=UPI00369BC020
MSLVNSRTVQGRCPVCGELHAACGPAADTTPVDQRMEVAAVGGPLKKYEVTTPSGVKTTMKLNEDDAKRLGVLDSGTQAEAEPAADDAAAEEPAAKARTPRNKARTVADKGDG